MSLDLYIIAKNKRTRVSSGIFVRENGTNKEILTIEEFRDHFPDCDEKQFQLYEVEDEDVWSGNATHNLCEMAEHIRTGKYNFYELLWHPDDNGFNTTTKVYKNLVYNGLTYMLRHRKKLEKYNPSNGWGSYDSFLKFVQSYVDALSKLDSDDYIIYANT